jgi:phosphatidylinositol alpha-1,6-mannosyltransferase
VRVVAIIPEAFGGVGGIAQYCRDFLNALAGDRRINSVTVLPRIIRSQAEPQIGKIEHRIAGANGLGRFCREVAHCALSGRSFDLVICGHINLLPFAEVLRARFGVPIVLLVYGSDAWQPTSRSLTNWLARRVDAAVAISAFTMRRFVSWTCLAASKQHILPNAVHPEQFGIGPKPVDLLERYNLMGRKVLVTLGRLSAVERSKGIDRVIQVLPQLLAKEPDLTYLVVGDGDDRLRLERLAEATGVSSRVVFAGYVAEEEKSRIYRLADAFVLAGKLEGFGFVLLEAMACGVPVVASKLDGSREAICDGALGQLADPDDPADLAAAILVALQQPRQIPQRLADFAYDRFCERLSGILAEIDQRVGVGA